MALTANREVDHYIDQELRAFQLEAGKHIYRGALVGLAISGYARPLIAGDKFVGVAYEEMANDDGKDDDCCIRIYTLGDFGLPLAGATIADIGRPVFASSDDAVTFVEGGNSYVGLMQDFVQDGEILLRLATLASAPE